MTLARYQSAVKAIGFGKVLPTAVYVHWKSGSDFGAALTTLLGTLAVRHQPGPEFNVVKFRTDELKINTRNTAHDVNAAIARAVKMLCS
jgi:hypothetical protein